MLFAVIPDPDFRPQRGPNTGHYCAFVSLFMCFELILTDVNLGITLFLHFSTEPVFLKRVPVACVIALPKGKRKPDEFRPLEQHDHSLLRRGKWICYGVFVRKMEHGIYIKYIFEYSH